MCECGKVKKVLGNKTGITSYSWTVCWGHVTKPIVYYSLFKVHEVKPLMHQNAAKCKVRTKLHYCTILTLMYIPIALHLVWYIHVLILESNQSLNFNTNIQINWKLIKSWILLFYIPKLLSKPLKIGQIFRKKKFSLKFVLQPRGTFSALKSKF